MVEAISKKAIAAAIRGHADIHFAVGNVQHHGMLMAWVTLIERGDFDLPSLPEGAAEGREEIQFIELTLLKMWAAAGIDEVYKYKYRIKAYREPLTNIDLLYDTSGRMFTDIEDIASTRDSDPEDGKVSVAELIRKRDYFASAEGAAEGQYPRQANGEGGWTISTAFLQTVQEVIEARSDYYDFGGLEGIQEVLLAVEALSHSGEPPVPSKSSMGLLLKEDEAND